jgi:hypothetical protein
MREKKIKGAISSCIFFSRIFLSLYSLAKNVAALATRAVD